MKNLFLTICCAFFLAFSAAAQNKDIDKGKEILGKAFAQKDPAKKNEMIQKATELFQKGGMKREMNLLIGDAFLEHSDLTQASNYYGRCDKAEKAEGYEKLAAAYVELAFSDEKQEAKNVKNALNYYGKSGKAKEGAKVIADKYYERGDKFLPKAIDFYLQASDTPSIEKMAGEFVSKGGETAMQAVDLYKRIGMNKKAGDLCFDMKQYTKAYEYYSAADDPEGLRKVADKFFELGQETESQNIFVKMVENYTKTANTEAIEKLGKENVNNMNYSLASRIYDKAGNLNLANKYLAYAKIMNMDFDSAKLLLNANDEAALAKAIDANMKFLTPLKVTKQQFDDWAGQQPYVSTELDPVTHTFRPVQKDEQMLVDYYKTIKDMIVDECQNVSKNVNGITNPQLKAMIQRKFLNYPAVGKVLDKSTFAIKLTKATTQVKDVYLKRL
ncbi:MAG: hypothetical protein U0T84_12840 [Chitinophagales bacterium]